MTDVRVMCSFRTSHKTKKLAKLAGPEAPLYLIYLWAFCAETDRTDGVLRGMGADDIELAVDWPGEDGKLVDALLRVGFLDEIKDGFAVHDWEDHQPWLVGAKARKAKAKAAAKARWGNAEENDEDATSMPGACDEDAQSNAPFPSLPIPSSPNASKPKKKTAPKGRRFSPDLVTDQWGEVAKEMRPDLDWKSTLANFCDYWTAKTGKEATKLDWLATWRYWLRNEKGQGRGPTTKRAAAEAKNLERMRRLGHG